MELPDDKFVMSARKSMRKLEARWVHNGVRYAWIDGPEPVWVSAANWDIRIFAEFPKVPCDRVFRLSLIGGGQIKVTERWRWFNLHCGNIGRILSCLHWMPNYEGYEAELKVTADDEPGVAGYSAFITGGEYEMETKAVFSRSAPQTILDRIAATLRLIDSAPENFYALLDGSIGCAFCRRPLDDDVSMLVGVEPECAHALGIPHSLAAASRRVELRRKLFSQGEVALSV